MKKCFVLTQFGKPHEWTQQFIDHVQHLEQYGWYWKIMTPNNFQSKGNVEIVPMTIEQFNDLVERKLKVRPQLALTEKGVPNLHITDFYIFTGVIFEDYLKNFEFWGITNIDVVYGRLDHYLPDSLLENCDVFTDDVDTINGVFSLYRNTKIVNELFSAMGNWAEIITQKPCPKCATNEGEHVLFGSDEYGLTEIMRRPEIRAEIRYVHPPYYPLHSYDRLIQHQPKPNLKVMPDGALIEIFEDPLMQQMPDNSLFTRGNFGREIMYFHFLTTKEWPL